jgi:hypothetical protein
MPNDYTCNIDEKDREERGFRHVPGPGGVSAVKNSSVGGI